MRFTKMQAVGNDFIVIEEPEGVALASLSKNACNRRFGIGADGLLLYAPQYNGLRFRIFNADGSEDTMCGNGLRCVVKLAVERGQVPAKGIAQTPSGDVPYAFSESVVTLTLPAPYFWEKSVTGATTVDTGSLHTVLWGVGLPTDENFLRASPRIENDPLFLEKTSVIWSVANLDNQLKIRIWERGVGETLGCGTGACAAAVVAIRQGRASATRPVIVTSKGGPLTVTWAGHDSSPISLTGPAEVVFSGTL